MMCMEEYLVCHIHLGYSPELNHARRLNEEEKTHYASWFRNIGFISIGESIELTHLDDLIVRNFLNREKSDGEFISTSGEVYIISQVEWDKLLKMEKLQEELLYRKERDEKIAELQDTISKCEAAEKLYTIDEANKKRKQYNNFYNEGGEGYIPHFWTIDEYEYAKEKLNELLSN